MGSDSLKGYSTATYISFSVRFPFESDQKAMQQLDDYVISSMDADSEESQVTSADGKKISAESKSKFKSNLAVTKFEIIDGGPERKFLQITVERSYKTQQATTGARREGKKEGVTSAGATLREGLRQINEDLPQIPYLTEEQKALLQKTFDLSISYGLISPSGAVKNKLFQKKLRQKTFQLEMEKLNFSQPIKWDLMYQVVEASPINL